MMHSKTELAFLRSVLGGASLAQAQENVSRLGLPRMSDQTLKVWKNIYIPLLQENRMYANSVVTGSMSMNDVISNIHKRMKG
jgi:hypothetical protein